MKNSVLLLAICGILCGYTNNGFAVTHTERNSYGETYILLKSDSIDGCVAYNGMYTSTEAWHIFSSSAEAMNCAEYSYICLKSDDTDCVASCTTCSTGTMLTKSKTGVSPCTTIDGDANDGGSYEYTKCVCDTRACTDDTEWTTVEPGWLKKTRRRCSLTSDSFCEEFETSSCAPGFYGSSSLDTNTCTPCPIWAGVYKNAAKTLLVRGTSALTTVEITGCYIKPGTYYDASGEFEMTGNCSYNE